MNWILKNALSKQLILKSILIILGLSAFGNDGYKIKIQIEGISDSVCYLANYYGDKVYLTDTAQVLKKGVFVFEGTEALPGGIYIVAGQSNNQYFEFLVDKNQNFSIHTAVPDLLQQIHFKNSTENDLFYSYINLSVQNRKKIEQLKKNKKLLEAGNDSILILNKQITHLNSQIAEFSDSIVQSNQGLFVSALLDAMKEPGEIFTQQLALGTDSVHAYQYYKNHYWDNLDVSDSRFLRTPLYHKRMEKFFSKVLLQNPDTINKEADIFISKTKPDKETYKYAIWYLTYKFETSKIMGFDEIFVHMVDNYYSTGEAYWADSTVVKSLAKRADALRDILIGSVAPELILIDTNFNFISMHHSEAPYMLVLFYEHDCGHCKKEIGEIKKWLAEDSLGIKVFAVCTDTSISKWKQYIVDQKLDWINVNGTRSVTADYHTLYDIRSTPTLFLLNEQKEIIAKRILASQLEPFIRNYHRNKQLNND